MTRTRLRGAMLVGAAAPLMAAVAMIVIAVSSGEPRAAAATGPCGTVHDGLTSEEFEFIGHLEDWRAANGRSPANLEISGALNAAAAWFAQHLVEEGPAGFNGHIDHLGRDWRLRAQDCGYPGTYSPLQYGSGEGSFFIQSSSSVNVGPSEAVYGGSIGGYPHNGVTYQGSGAYISTSPSSSIPAKCVGAAKYQSGNAVAWIVVIAQYPANQACPQPVTGTPPTSTPTQGTIVSTPTPTASPSPAATPSPTPPVVPTATGLRAIAPQVVSDVTHPAN